MNKYHIGVRLKGYSKDYVKSLFCSISNRCGLNEFNQCIPHFTFVRPFSTKDEAEVIKLFDETLSKYSIVNLGKPIIYGIEGFGIFDNKEKVIYAKLEKNESIENIIGDLENSLEGKVSYFGDKIQLPEEEGINLHCTIVSRGVNSSYFSVLDFLNSQSFEKIRQPLLRVYLLKNNSNLKHKLILREYDFYLNDGHGANLERLDAINSILFRKTMAEFVRHTGYQISSEGIVLPGVALNL